MGFSKPLALSTKCSTIFIEILNVHCYFAISALNIISSGGSFVWKQNSCMEYVPKTSHADKISSKIFLSCEFAFSGVCSFENVKYFSW